jgi:hypothetical protein
MPREVWEYETARGDSRAPVHSRNFYYPLSFCAYFHLFSKWQWPHGSSFAKPKVFLPPFSKIKKFLKALLVLLFTDKNFFACCVRIVRVLSIEMPTKTNFWKHRIEPVIKEILFARFVAKTCTLVYKLSLTKCTRYNHDESLFRMPLAVFRKPFVTAKRLSVSLSIV